jgi:Family of unknown function (DUF6286)
MRLVIPVLTRLLSALAALAILAVGVVILIELVANWTGNGFVILPDDWPDQLRTTSWDDTLVRNLLIASLVVGALLILAACWPHPPLTVPTNQPNVRMERHALESAVRRRLLSVDGASGARVRATASRIDARVDTTRRFQPEQVRAAATTALAEFCQQHELALEPRVRLRARGETR